MLAKICINEKCNKEFDPRKGYSTQKYCCKECKKEFNNNQQEPNIDHDHKTDKVRGLLCGPCNTALGLLDDSILNCAFLSGYLRDRG